MKDPRELIGSLKELEKEFAKITKDMNPMREMAEAVLKQPKVRKVKKVNIGEHNVELALLENNTIKIVSANREQADILFKEIHLYEKPKSLLDAIKGYFTKVLR